MTIWNLKDIETPVGWEDCLLTIKSDKKFQVLCDFLEYEQRDYREVLPIYPAKENIYNAFNYVSPSNLKVVIIGQDPYHNPGQAMGLSFSVPRDFKIPPSLKTIYKNLERNFGYQIPLHGDLTHWATQGVLLLNSALTVRHNCPNSHSGKWEFWTNHVINWISNNVDNVVFILWGRDAQEKEEFINNKEKHLILKGLHPSPMSNRTKGEHPFISLNHFKDCNDYLISNNKSLINWEIK